MPSSNTMTKNGKEEIGNNATDEIIVKNKKTDDWQKQMLKRLQESAVPEPIKVACTAPPPGKPEYMGEEFHGKITKEDEKRLLDGKSGRYIVRESFSVKRPDEFTLAFNYDSDIQHVKLIYIPTNRTFKTEDSMKEFKTILELMTDVLSLFQDFKRRQTAKKEKYSKPHIFNSHNYKHPKWCDECGQFLWGFKSQGYKCEDCGINVHKSCKEQAPLPCSKVIVGRKISYLKEEKLYKKRSSKPDINNGSSSPPLTNYFVIRSPHKFDVQCLYFKQCSRFLSAFNIRDSFIDMNSNLTRCFCDKCTAQKKEEGNNENFMSCSLKQWSRFEFEPKDDALKRNVKNWEVVYFAIKPQYIIEVIQKFFTPPDDTDEDLDLVVAPSLAYTTLDMEIENWSYKFTDTHTNGDLYAQTVLEVYLKPDSYEILPMPEHQPQTHDCGPQIVPEHWKVNDQTNVYPKSILVKIFDKDL